MTTPTQHTPLTSQPNPDIQALAAPAAPSYTGPSNPNNLNSSTVITSQPTTIPKPEPSYKRHIRESRVKTGTQEWLNDKWSCFEGAPKADNYLCLKATFCPCFVYGRTQARIKDPSLSGYERVNSDCIMWYGGSCIGLGWVFNFLTRSSLRETHDLKGDTLSDCLFSWCCHCCALIQQEKEVTGRQLIAARDGGYVQQREMSATPGGNVGIDGVVH